MNVEVSKLSDGMSSKGEGFLTGEEGRNMFQSAMTTLRDCSSTEMELCRNIHMLIDVVNKDTVDNALSEMIRQCNSAFACVRRSCLCAVSEILPLVQDHDLFPLVSKCCEDCDSSVRQCAVRMIPLVCSKTAMLDAEGLLQFRSADADPTVREESYLALSTLHRQRETSAGLYSVACHGIRDNYVCVRLAALEYMLLLTNSHGKEYVISTDNSKSGFLKLSEDFFRRVSSATQDVDAKIRKRAYELLGDFENISEEVMLRTLDMKPMDPYVDHESLDMDVDESPDGLSDGAVVEIVEEYMSSGVHVIGILVTGMEDEDPDVRCAVVGSVRKTCRQSKRFAVRALDTIVDMFHDEIPDVRHCAVETLGEVAGIIALEDDHISVTLGVCDDATASVREAARIVISKSRVSSASLLHDIITRLHRNACKYPEDENSVLICSYSVGALNNQLMVILIPKFLGILPDFATAEPNKEEKSYVVFLSALLGAYDRDKAIRSSFPPFIQDHFCYLKEKYTNILRDSRRLSLEDEDVYDLEVMNEICAILEGSSRDFWNSFGDDASSRMYLKRCRGQKRVIRKLVPSIEDDNWSFAQFSLFLLSIFDDLCASKGEFCSEHLRRTIGRIALCSFLESRSDKFDVDSQSVNRDLLVAANTGHRSVVIDALRKVDIQFITRSRFLIKVCSAVVTAPVSHEEDPVEWMSDVPITLPVTAEIHNFPGFEENDSNSENSFQVFVELSLPRQESRYFAVQRENFSFQGRRCILKTEVSLMLGRWTAPAPLGISILLRRLSFSPSDVRISKIAKYFVHPKR